MMSPELFKDAMSQMVASVHIITTSFQGARAGATAIAFSSVTDTPPTLMVCLNKQGRTAQHILKSKAFIVNSLKATDQPLAEVFSGRTGVNGEARFAFGQWEGEMPQLHSALVQFKCSLSGKKIIGSHVVLFGSVLNIKSHPAPALFYHARKYGEI